MASGIRSCRVVSRNDRSAAGSRPTSVLTRASPGRHQKAGEQLLARADGRQQGRMRIPASRLAASGLTAARSAAGGKTLSAAGLSLMCCSWATAVVPLRHPCGLPHAVVGIGFAVAAADGPEDFRADARDTLACPAAVEEAAERSRELTKQSFVAANGGNATAELAETSRRCTARRKHRESKGDWQQHCKLTSQAH